jgi:cell wall assembly regulator SMI1
MEASLSAAAESLWQTLELRLARAHPGLLARLPAGADVRALDAIERELGVRLPPLARAIYLVHDGIGMPHIKDRRVCQSYFLSLADALSAWRSQRDALREGRFGDLRIERVGGPVRADWWNTRWLPIASTATGDFDCIDVDPAQGGRPGQVITYWHDDRERFVRAPDLAEYLLEEVDAAEWAIGEGLLPTPPPWRGTHEA